MVSSLLTKLSGRDTQQDRMTLNATYESYSTRKESAFPCVILERPPNNSSSNYATSEQAHSIATNNRSDNLWQQHETLAGLKRRRFRKQQRH